MPAKTLPLFGIYQSLYDSVLVSSKILAYVDSVILLECSTMGWGNIVCQSPGCRLVIVYHHHQMLSMLCEMMEGFWCIRSQAVHHNDHSPSMIRMDNTNQSCSVYTMAIFSINIIKTFEQRFPYTMRVTAWMGYGTMRVDICPYPVRW